MKRVLITAGGVYGRLDDNKLVGNRSRGLWATKYANHLWREKNYEVTLLVPDTWTDQVPTAARNWSLIKHTGFDDYRQLCKSYAPHMDVAIMAAAVVNWIPAEPIKGKMKTEGYKVGDRINVPFYLAPRVIEEMKVANPKLTLVGCKMLSGSDRETLIEAAYHTLLHSHANVVLANDLQGLKTKHLVYQDRAVFTYENEFDKLFAALDDVLADDHYATSWIQKNAPSSPEARELFDQIVNSRRARFIHRAANSDRVFGAVLVRDGDGYLVSPREKGEMFNSASATHVSEVTGRLVVTEGPAKATLNAPLLIRVAEKYKANAVLHLHESMPNVPTVPYAPPGTVRDCLRDIPGPAFNIEGHGFIAVVV